MLKRLAIVNSIISRSLSSTDELCALLRCVVQSVNSSPVSIQTQALALAGSQSWLTLLRPSIPIGWRLRLLRENFTQQTQYELSTQFVKVHVPQSAAFFFCMSHRFLLQPNWVVILVHSLTVVWIPLKCNNSRHLVYTHMPSSLSKHGLALAIPAAKGQWCLVTGRWLRVGLRRTGHASQTQ